MDNFDNLRKREEKFLNSYIVLLKAELIFTNKSSLKLGLVADPVIEAIAGLEFEDGLRRGVLPGGCWGP